MKNLTIIMPVLNGSQYIQQALDSIARQQNDDLEVIIINDGSTDNTQSICEAFAVNSTIPTQILQTHKVGPAAARNKAIEISDTPFITFLDHDDLWPEERISSHTNTFEQYPEASVITGKIELSAEDPVTLSHFNFDSEDKRFYGVNLGASTFKKAVFERIGVFDPGLKFGEDHDLFFRIREQQLPIHYLNQTSLFYRQHEANMTAGKSAKELNMLTIIRRSLARRQGSKLQEMGKE